jgi:hypothetical protein
MAEKSQKPGRPLKSDVPLDAQLNLRLTKPELKRLRAEAKRSGITVSDLLMRPWREKEE